MTNEAPRTGARFGIAPAGYRLPGATRVGTVHLQVADPARSIDYYGEVLGLVPIERAEGRVALGARGGDRPLLSLRSGAVRPAPPRGAYGLFHFAVLLPDRSALGRFAAHAIDRRERLGMADHLVSEALYLTDPDGLGIEVYADRPRDLWRGSPELAMGTEPLDVEGLIAACGGGRWDGMPPGATMGHVHLHVGSLSEAEAFYHRALGFDKTVWSYPGALFFSAGGYHHQLGTNTWSPGPSAADDQARLLEWELIVPGEGAAAEAAASLGAAGYQVRAAGRGWGAADPWGTRLRLEPAGA